ncbi:hypothetical protein Celaphus_00013027, partial [Cervus elaphus hippelaphus]
MTFVNTKDNCYLCWFPGPVIKAEVGQIIQVTFYNNASVPLSIHPHGLLYNKNNEGSFYGTPGGAINGYMYGNLPGLDMCLGDNVSWHVLSVGSSQDLHGIYFSGNTFTSLGSRDDTVVVNPHISQTLLMTPDSTGKLWIFSISLKYAQTMKKQCLQYALNIYQEAKVIYIAAEEIVWDYSPSSDWERELQHLQGQNETNIYLDRVETYLGSKYKKVVYGQYDDITFTNQTVRNDDEMHLDILGPIIFLSPGEKIYVVFKNKASRPYSIHAHGVKTDSPTVAATQPGTCFGRKRSPRAFMQDCEDNDLNSGLVGPLIVCRKDTKENIVHRVLFFMTFDENESWYIEENINTYAQEPNQVVRNDITFKRSNEMHGNVHSLTHWLAPTGGSAQREQIKVCIPINGRMFGNNQGLVFHVGSEVNWYLIGIGDQADLHTAHFHGHSFIFM